MRLLVILPAYNEGENIEKVVENLTISCPQYDYIIVNDGSSDSTAQICRENGFPLLDLSVNLGLSGAVGAGMKYAWKNGYDAAVQLDADGQHRPEYLSQMLSEIETGKDIVIGSRFLNDKKPLSLRMMGSRLISMAILLTTGQKITDPTSGLRMYSSRIVREFACEINHSPEPDTISYLIRKGARAKEIPVKMDERTAGKSYLNTVSSMKYMLGIGISIILVQWFRGGTLTEAKEEEKKNGT